MNILNNDTICAIATGQGGAIAIIRVSGSSCFKIADNLFFGKLLSLQQAQGNSIHFGTIKNKETIVDEVLISVFKNPKSYTGEDSVEISCHASQYIQQEILNLLIEKGCRLARPGEFTMRAFFNGKMDLSQSEAVADIIASNSEASHKIAMHQMRGGFSNEIQLLRSELMNLASLIELELDFGEEDVEFADRNQLQNLIAKIDKIINNLIDSFKLGNVIKNGIPVVIAGKPNVGKSTLLNILLNEDRAIVSEIPGTTRDLIEEEINFKGTIFRFVDTAGIRETRDTIEALGVKKTLQKIKESALVVYLFDVHEVSKRELGRIVLNLNAEIGNSDAKILLVANKIDRENIDYLKEEYKEFENLIFISAREKININKLIDNLVDIVNMKGIDLNQTIVSNSRHYEALLKTQESLSNVKNSMLNNISSDLLALDIRNALQFLGEISGEVSTNDLLGNIFGNFCIGK